VGWYHKSYTICVVSAETDDQVANGSVLFHQCDIGFRSRMMEDAAVESDNQQ
jgi:hypothetical protein